MTKKAITNPAQFKKDLESKMKTLYNKGAKLQMQGCLNGDLDQLQKSESAYAQFNSLARVYCSMFAEESS